MPATPVGRHLCRQVPNGTAAGSALPNPCRAEARPTKPVAGMARSYISTLTIALPIPISAAPETRPAQIGSQPSTQSA